MAFDPNKLSPITQTTGGFDPSKLSPVQTQSTPNQPMADSIWSSLATSLGNRLQPIIQGAKDISNAPNPLEAGLRTAMEAGNVAGGIAGGITDIAGAAGQALGIPTLGEKVSGAVAGGLQGAIPQNITNFLATSARPAIKALAQGLDSYNQFKQNNPEIAQQFENVLNTGLLAVGGKEAPAVGEAVKPIAEAGLRTVGETAGKAATSLEEFAAKQGVDQALSIIQPTLKEMRTEVASGARASEKGALGSISAVPTNSELQAAKLLQGVVDTSKTFTENRDAIENAITKEATALETKLQEPGNSFIAPKKELVAKLNAAAQELKKSPTITGDAQVSAQRLINGAIEKINDSSGTAKGYLDARKSFDSWVKSQKPSAFDPKYENATSLALRTIRNTWNQFLEDKAPNAGVRDSLHTQSLMYRALDNVSSKAAAEVGTNAITRAFGEVGGIIQRHPLVSAEAALGIGFGGHILASIVSSPVIVASLLATGAYKLGKAIITSDMVIKSLDTLLRSTEANLAPADKTAIESVIEQLKKPRGGMSIEDVSGKAQGEIPKLSALEKEATKYKTAEDFYERMGSKNLSALREKGIRGKEQVTKYWEDITGLKAEDAYRMSHRPTEGVRAFNLTEKVNGESAIPKDMYTQWYGSRGTKADLESISVLKNIKGKPEASVTIYRASPKESFNSGDWVTFSKTYAQEHASGNNTKVFSKTVKAKDVRWAMDDINEFGYYPQK